MHSTQIDITDYVNTLLQLYNDVFLKKVFDLLILSADTL